MDLAELFRRKGELHTNLEITQQQLAIVNKQISEALNKPKEEPKQELKEAKEAESSG